jgi:hypothetical protein
MKGEFEVNESIDVDAAFRNTVMSVSFKRKYDKKCKGNFDSLEISFSSRINSDSIMTTTIYGASLETIEQMRELLDDVAQKLQLKSETGD